MAKNKRKHSTETNQINKKTRSDLSTQEAMEDLINRNLIDLENPPKEGSDDRDNTDGSPTSDIHIEEEKDLLNDSSLSSVKSDDIFVSPLDPSNTSIAVDVDMPKEIFKHLQHLRIAIGPLLELKDTLDKVVKSNEKLTESNLKLEKKLIKQEKLTNLLGKEVVKLKKKNIKLLKSIPKTIPESNITNDLHVNYNSRESILDKKLRVLPTWRQLFFRRRDEFKREFRNRSKAEIYEKYRELKYLPKKFRPKFARTQEEFNVKEEAAFTALDTSKRVCVLDADQAKSNYMAIDNEAVKQIRDSGIDAEEKTFLEQLWIKEVTNAEERGKTLCYKEITYMNNLPYNEEYYGYIGCSSDINQQQQPTSNNDRSTSNRFESTSNQQAAEQTTGEWTTVNRHRNNYRKRSTNTIRVNNTNRWGQGDQDYRWNSGYNYQNNWRHFNNNSHLANNYQTQNYTNNQGSGFWN